MRNFSYKIFTLVMFFVLFGYVATCHAALQVMGGAADQKKFKEMLQTGVGKDATVNVDDKGNVTLTGDPKTEFGKRLKQIIDDKRNAVMLVLETMTAGRSDQPNGCVPFGAWNRDQEKFKAYDQKTKGHGKHGIDVGDFMMMATDSNTGVANQQAILMHEIWEAHDGLKSGHTSTNAQLLRQPGATAPRPLPSTNGYQQFIFSAQHTDNELPKQQTFDQIWFIVRLHLSTHSCLLETVF
jgi:hypothetical protein